MLGRSTCLLRGQRLGSPMCGSIEALFATGIPRAAWAWACASGVCVCVCVQTRTFGMQMQQAKDGGRGSSPRPPPPPKRAPQIPTKTDAPDAGGPPDHMRHGVGASRRSRTPIVRVAFSANKTGPLKPPPKTNDRGPSAGDSAMALSIEGLPQTPPPPLPPPHPPKQRCKPDVPIAHTAHTSTPAPPRAKGEEGQ